MAIQSNLIVIVFFVLAGLLLAGLIVFLVIYFSRSTKKTEVRDRTTPLSEVIPKDPIISTEKEAVKEISHTRLVTLGRSIKDDQFAVLFGDEWIEDASQLSFVQRNRLEKNLQEAQNWLGVETKKESIPAPKVKDVDSTDVVPPLVPTKTAEKHKRQLSIVEQVDEVLQDLLESSLLKGRNIRLTELPNKGVTVWVGNEYYDGINAVPDEDVKRIIRQAVKKWEESSGV
ncbi:MAG: hypothetical protein CVU40_18020 [Chloroflexi bacterium HGW-Chloroflexi-2]|jgi:hypothetical protein|nr:MAG: hypothetical protein CVU40_18020 [Chloroflexi bacterium HGW-Chloroflexi-2]